MEKVLLVDDVATNLKCVSNILEGRYQIFTAKTGEDALRSIKENRPDLVLLDVCLPDMDGYEVLKRIKEDEFGKSVPVIFLTGESGVESEIKGRNMGAVDFIRKPFMPPILLKSIQNALDDGR